MISKTLVVVLRLFLIYTSCVIVLSGQEKDVELKDTLVTVKMDKQPLGVVFRYLMEKYDIPIGFEESILDRNQTDFNFQTNLPSVAGYKLSNSDSSITIITKSERIYNAPLHPITLDLNQVKLEVVFTEITKQMENYECKINDEVVNIFPIKGRDERFKNLMSLMIPNFNLDKGKTVKDITRQIQLSPNFRRFIFKNKLFFHGIRNGADFEIESQYGRKINKEMDFSNLTFQELLNKIAKTKKGGWALKWKGIYKGKEFIDIDI